MRPQTKLVREQAARTANREHTEALFLSSSFIFDDAESAAEKFAAPMSEYVYSRFSNPNVKTLGARVAALEGAPAALCTASGMSAVLSSVMGLCRAGDTVLCGGEVFGATASLLSGFISKFGVNIKYVFGGADEWRKAAKEGASFFLLETPSNPMLGILDVAKIAEIAREKNAVLAVDNCFCPVGQKPLSLGADLVVHSATKYLDGQGRVLGGAVAGSEELVCGRISPFLRAGGPALSPFNAWLVSRGMETLPQRMRAHCEAAKDLAEWLQTRPRLKKVMYTGLPSHPGGGLAMRQQSGMGGGIITLKLEGGRAEAWRFINGLKIFSITANFGDVKSTATHPETTTHSRVSEEHRARIGLTEDIVRLSVGLEDVEDLREDLEQALAAVS